MAFALKKTKKVTTSSGKKAAGKVSRGAKRQKQGGKQRFVLMVGDEGAILVYMAGRKVVRRLFAPSPQGEHTETIVELMRTNPRVPVWILADVLDQQYVRQTFPPVSSMSVGGLVSRRLDRDFHAEDLKGALPLGREKTGRKEWNYLLISLVKTPLMSAWLDLILELPNEFKGIHLVPIESTVYFASLSKAVHGQKPLPWQLLISHNKVSGFRQVVMHDGKIVFTRVTQAIDDAIPAVIAGNIEQEIINTIEYLRRLEFNDNSTLEAMAIVSQDVSESLDITRFTFGRTHVLSPMDVAEAMKFEQAALSADSYGDVVMATAFGAASKHVLKFTTAYGKLLSKLYLASRSVMAVAALGGIVLAGMGGYNLWNAKETSAAIEQINGNRQRSLPELESLKKAVSGLSKDIAFKSAVVSVHESYIKDAIGPEDFAVALAPVLKTEPRLASVDWQYRSDAKSPSPGMSPPPSSGGAPGAPVVIKAEFIFNDKYESVDDIAKAFQMFLDELKRALPQYEITHDPLPWAKEVKQNVEIFLDQTKKPDNAIKEAQTKVMLTFSGPNKVAAPAGGVTP